MDDMTLIELFAHDAHTARQDEILAHHSAMLDRVDDRGPSAHGRHAANLGQHGQTA